MKRAAVIGIGFAVLAQGFPVGSASLAHAEEPRTPVLQGRIFSDIYFSTQDALLSESSQISTSAWLELEPRFNEYSLGMLALEGTVTAASAYSPSKGVTQFGLREACFQYARSGILFKAGKQIIPWGNADGFNPTDLLSAKDFTRFSPDEEVQRIGSTSLLFSWTPSGGNSPWTFTSVLTPVFPRSKLLIPSGALPSGASLGSEVAPPANLANIEAALKLSRFSNGWDFSIMAMKGWKHLPELTFGGITGAGQVSILPEFHSIRALGGDASISWGKFIFRAEMAYVWTENNDGTDPTKQPSHFDAVLGAERPLGDDFRIHGQWIFKYYPAYLPPQDAVAASNAMIHSYQERDRWGFTLRLAYEPSHADWSAEVSTLAYPATRELLMRPKAVYRWTGSLRTELGVDHYAGPADRPFGVWKQFNSVFMQAKFTF